MLIALPERAWSSPRLGRVVLRVMGVFFIGMAVLQAWPGRGFWQGRLDTGVPRDAHRDGASKCRRRPSRAFISSWLASFAAFDAAHGWAVNLFLVVCLAADRGRLCVGGRPACVRVAVCAGIVLCLADWVLVEDFGFFGGVGTDPNSMIPMALVFVAGYLAHHERARRWSTTPSTRAAAARASGRRSGQAGEPAGLRLPRSLAALAAIGITLVGVVPMAAPRSNPNADPIIAEAIDGSPDVVDTPAPPFTPRRSERGRRCRSPSLRGKAVAMTFLDPVCVSDCPLIAQEFRQADDLLGRDARRVAMVAAVVANPVYRARPLPVGLRPPGGPAEAFSNWHYLTGSSARAAAGLGRLRRRGRLCPWRRDDRPQRHLPT